MITRVRHLRLSLVKGVYIRQQCEYVLRASQGAFNFTDLDDGCPALLWRKADSRTAHRKITKSGVPHRVKYYVIFVVHT